MTSAPNYPPRRGVIVLVEDDPRYAWRELRIRVAEIYAASPAPSSWSHVRQRLLAAGFSLRAPKPSGEPVLSTPSAVSCEGGELVYRQRYERLR